MTSVDQITAPATSGPARAVLCIGHDLADHVSGQTDQQAGSKAAPSTVTHAFSDYTATSTLLGDTL